MREKMGRAVWVLYLVAFLVFAFIFPRLLISQLGPENPWTNYFYLYGFGFFYTGSGVWLVLKSGACNLNREHDRFWFKILLAGWAYFACLHALWIYLAISIPFRGVL